MTNYYFDPIGVDTSEIVDQQTIDADDVKEPLDALKLAVEDMDTNLYNAFGNKAFDSTAIPNAQTSSTTFVQIPAASLTLTTTGGDVLVSFNGSFWTMLQDFLYLELTMDDVPVGGANGIFVQLNYDWDRDAISLSHLFRNVAPGPHTFKVLWKIINEGGPPNLAEVSHRYTLAQFWAREL